MAKPASKEQLKDYCLRRLGFPVIDINVDDDQVDDRIDDALQMFANYHFDGTEKDYLAIQMTAGIIANSYVELPDSVIGVNKVFSVVGDSVSIGGNGVNFNIFDLNYQLRLNELYDFTSSSYQYYWIARSHIRMLEMILTGENPIRFNKKMGKLYVDMNWSAPEVAEGQYMLIECLKVLDPDTYTKVYNDSWLKDYATQLIKKQWGENLKKYGNYVLPGGMVINGQQIYDEAAAEILALEEKLRDTYEEPPTFEVG
jgi:hypothetical protein